MQRPNKSQEDEAHPPRKGAGRQRSEIYATDFQYLFRLFELYSWIQVEADKVYLQRTGVITLAEGLLVVAFTSIPFTQSYMGKITGIGIASVGLFLSILWLFFEQRNEIYFLGRGVVLSNLEKDLIELAQAKGLAFQSFWQAVPAWVRQHAPWYRRLSAPLILRGLVPALFIIGWSFLLIIAVLVGGAESMPQSRDSPDGGSPPLPNEAPTENITSERINSNTGGGCVVVMYRWT